MMRIRKALLVPFLMTAMPLGVIAASDASKDRVVTVGEFAVMLNAAKAKAGRPALEATLAAQSLVRSGVPLGDLSVPLSEGRLAEILSHFGLKTRTSTPDRTVSAGKAEAAILLASSSLTAAAAPSEQTEIPQCVMDCIENEKNHGQCLNCCRECPENLTSRGCSRLCKEDEVSPDEPRP